MGSRSLFPQGGSPKAGLRLAQLPALAFFVIVVIATVTVIEVHRSHGEAHEETQLHAADESADAAGGLRRAAKSHLELEIMSELEPAHATKSSASSQQRGGADADRKAQGGSDGSKASGGGHAADTAAGGGGRGHTGSGGGGKHKGGASKKRLSAKLSKAVAAMLEEDDKIDPVCRIEEHANYLGEVVVKWGHLNMRPTASECCSSCMMDPQCNVWVWCASPAGCGAGRAFQECWLKHASIKSIRESVGTSQSDIPWTSGTMVDPEDLHQTDNTETVRLKKLKDDKNTPLVYMDVTIKGRPAGRIVVALLYNKSPLAAENFRQLCTGEKGIVPAGHTGAGTLYSFKGSTFYRIVDRFIDQSGVNTDSVFGGMFRDDPGGLALKHDRQGLLSMANTGPNTNTAHFSILLAPAPHLDGHYTIFGEVVEGMGVARAVNALARGKKENTAGPEEQAVIADCGQLRGPSKEVELLLAVALKLGTGPLNNGTADGASSSLIAASTSTSTTSASSATSSSSSSSSLRLRF